MRRLGHTVAALALIAVGISCSNDSGATAFPRTVTMQGISFTLPSQLQYRTDGSTSSAESFDSFYGNVPLGPACENNGCGLPRISLLPSGSVVIGIGVLSGAGVGSVNPDGLAPNTTIAGRDALWTSDKPGTCGGDETITARIPNRTGGGIIVRACLSGPDLSAGEATVEAVIASAVFVGG